MAIPKAREHGPVKLKRRNTDAKKYAPCPLSHEPNEETRQAIREARQGIGVTTYKSVDEMWAALVK